MDNRITIVIIISADAEWTKVKEYFTDCVEKPSPYGYWFIEEYQLSPEIITPIVFLHGGWGKVAAAGSTQYAIDRWKPELIINLGTCGGFKGEIDREAIILVTKTIIYDIYELMGDPEEHIYTYQTEINNSWINGPMPINVVKTCLVSGDRDLIPDEISILKMKYHAVAGDWESGAIAWVANKNNTNCMILRGVTDLVGDEKGEAYNGKQGVFYQNTELVMKILLDSVPDWLRKWIVHQIFNKLEEEPAKNNC